MIEFIGWLLIVVGMGGLAAMGLGWLFGWFDEE